MKKENIKHIIWDWNGTLLNDTENCVHIMNHILASREMPTLTVERYREIFTFPVRDYYACLGFDFTKESFEQLGTEFITLYEANKYTYPLFNDTRSGLQSVHDSGIAQSVLSAYHQDNLRNLIEHLKLSAFFTHIIGLDHHYATSKAELGQNLIQSIKAKPSEVYLIGDSVHDYEVALAMGATPLLVSRGHQNLDQLVQCNCQIFSTIQEVVASVL